MKPLEIKLNREFLALQKEIEDYWFTGGNDHISEFADKVIREKYFEIQGIVTELDKLCKSEDFTIQKCNGLSYFFKDTLINFNDYLYNDTTKINGFQKDLFDSLPDTSKKIMEEIQVIQGLAYYNNMQKLANKIEARTWQTIGRITFILNTVLDEVITPYKKAINDEINKVEKILKNKHDEIESAKTIEEVNKIQIQKIFDYKEMDRLIRLNGYEPVRQSGDHKIYSDNNGKCIPIPQHELGLGLSLRIQKQVLRVNN